MKKNLNEELKRLHTLTYGGKVIEESDFIKRILKSLGIKDDKEFKIDEPKKSDYLTGDVEDFYQTLENAITKGGLSRQPRGEYTYQKEVEALQVGLLILGYKLPIHGVDGKFGPETLDAVNEFKKDNKINESFNINESYFNNILSESVLQSPLERGMGTGGNFGVHRKGLDRPGKKHSGVDLKARYEPVLSPADGVVIDAKIRKNACGGTLYIDHQNGFKSRYCHLKQIDVQKDDTVKQGQQVGISGGGKNDGISAGHSTGPHLHFELYKNGKLVNPRDYVGNEIPTKIEKSGNEDTKTKKVSASPELIKKLIEKLKSKNITSEDLKPYVDKLDEKKVSNYIGTTDDDFYTSILTCIGATSTEENMLFMYAWRQSEKGTYKNNPFNTKRKYEDAVGNEVKNYKTPQDGINATCETLKLPRYKCIVDGLKNNIGALKISKDCNSSLKTWGTHESYPLVTDVLLGYEKGNKPKPPKISV